MLKITFASSLEQLAEQCAAVLRIAPADAFEREWIALPTGGVRGWLQRRLAAQLGATGDDGRDGVSANIDFVRADGLRHALLDSAATESVSVGDPWSIEAMTWALMALVANGSIDRVGKAPQNRTDEPGRVARSSEEPLAAWAARQASRFARYHIYRPDIIRAWAAQSNDGDATQAALYRAIRSRIGRPNPVEALDGLAGAFAQSDPAPLAGLPGRLVFFGFTLPPDGIWFTDLVSSVSAQRDVHGFFLDPCPTLSPDERHGLAASWAKPATESRRVFAAGGVEATAISVTTTAPSENVEPILLRLQRTIAGVPVLPAALADDDRSFVVHACQGITRQVEVLRDELLHRLADDPTLSEDDIVVFCADPEAVAPVIASVLGDSAQPWTDPGPRERTPRLRYHIDGLSSRQVNPVADAFAQLLELLTGRVTSIEVLNFCQLDAVRRRWGFDDDDIARFRHWASELNVRWGLDPAHRARLDFPDPLELGTWHRALRRLAFGVAYASDDLVLGPQDAPIAPEGIEGDDVDRLGRLADLVARIAELAEDVSEAVNVQQRLQQLSGALGEFFAPEPDRRGQLDEVQQACAVPDDVVVNDSAIGTDFKVTLADLRPLLIGRLPGRSGSSGVYRGGVTVTTPDALRGVPFRIVAFLGLDDTWVPTDAADSADIMSLERRDGDPDRRADTRLSLLNALMSAKDALIITRNATSITTNAGVPEGILMGELFDSVAALVVAGDDGKGVDPRTTVLSRLTTIHPRQGTDPSSFTATSQVAALSRVGPVPWSFDGVAREAAAASLRPSSGQRHEPGDTPLGRRVTDRAEEIDLDELCGFLRDPDKYVCKNTFDVRLPYDEQDPSESLPTSLDALEAYDLRRRMFEVLDAGGDLDGVQRWAQAHDLLPVGVTGTSVFAEQWRYVKAIADKAQDYRQGRRPADVPIDIDLGGDRRLVGNLQCFLSDDDGVVIDVRASSSAKPGDRLASLAKLFALATVDPGRQWWTISIRRGDRAKPISQYRQVLPPESSGDRKGLPVAWMEGLTRMAQLLDVAALGAVPIPTGMVEKSSTTGGAWTKRPEKTFAEDFIKHANLRFLYGYHDFARLRSQPVHGDDPLSARPAEGNADSCRSDRPDHLRQVVLHDAVGSLIASEVGKEPIRSGN